MDVSEEPNGSSQLAEQLQRALADLERAYDIPLEALGDALELKDAEAGGHSKRVTAFSIAIARAMGIPDDRIRVIARGAFLHDIGKLAIPDAILRKPSKLTYDEIKCMKEHSRFGYQMLRNIPFLAEAAEIVYAHHECFDGSGYPRALKAEEIPIGARIVAVVEALDAMRSDQPYRPALSFDEARDEIVRWSGRMFDPEVVKFHLTIPEKMWEDLRREILRPQTLT